MVKDRMCFYLAVLMDGKQRYLLFEGAACFLNFVLETLLAIYV